MILNKEQATLQAAVQPKRHATPLAMRRRAA